MTPTRNAPRQSERDFQRAVMELAEMSGWETLHCRTSMQQGRYLTATTGTMAKGWPDLVLVHPEDRRIIFAELKAEGGRPTIEQTAVLDKLAHLDWHQWNTPGIGWVLPRVEAHLWHPRDWPEIERILSMKGESRDAA